VIIDARFPVDNHPIHRDLVAGPDQDDVVEKDLRCGDLDGLAVTDDGRFRRRQVEQGADRIGRPGPRAHLHPVPEEDKRKEDHRGFVEDLRVEEKRGADAERVASADGQGDEHGHVEDAMAKRAGCPDEKHLAAPKDSGRREDEEEDVVGHAERCRNVEVEDIREEGRVEEDGNREQEREPEAVAHIPHHRLHAHTRSVAHPMRHLGHLAGGRACCSLFMAGMHVMGNRLELHRC